MSDTLEHLGKIIPPGIPLGRDAVHIAVMPIEAGDNLVPGDHVSIGPTSHKAYLTSEGQGVGIVDPFLDGTVNKGQRFWLFLYPGAIPYWAV